MAARDTSQLTRLEGEQGSALQKGASVYHRPDTFQHEPDVSAKMRPRLLAKALGLFSIGLGLTALLAPKRTAQLIGAPNKMKTRAILQGIGLREIASGVVILRERYPVDGLRMRVAGDVMDLALLTRAMQSRKSDHDRVGIATATVLGITALDAVASQWLSHSDPTRRGVWAGRGIQVDKSITINLPTDMLYGYWRNFQNLPRFMRHLESVQIIDGQRSHWKTRAPAGMSVEWDAEIVDDRINELIAWRSIEGADVKNAGVVRFTPAPGGRGTEVHVILRYEPPAGKLGATLAKLFGEEPEIQIADDLRALKQVLETGEIVRSEGAVMGERLKHRPAQPPESLSEV